MTIGLTVLGGSAAWPNPGQGCSSYLVTSAEIRVLIDCGPNTLLELRRHADFRALDAIVISHCHSDHILDLVPYRYGLKYGPDRTERRIPVCLPPGGVERLNLLADALAFGTEGSMGFWTDVFDLQEYDPDTDLAIGVFTIAFAPTQHFVACFAMRISSRDGSALGYSADTGSIEPLVELMRRTALVVVEATLRDHGDIPLEERGHLTPEDAGRLANACNAETLLLTHLWSERPDDAVIEAAASVFDGTILVAKPGLYVER